MKTQILKLLPLLILAACSSSPAQKTYVPIPPAKVSVSDSQKALLKEMTEKPKVVMLDHQFFQVFYDAQIRLPRFVKYTVTADQAKGVVAPQKNFKLDPILVDRYLPAVSPKEYVNSGYVPVQMAPMADFANNPKAQEESLVMSNTIPQKASFYKKSWQPLEDQVHRWACGEGKITVLSGPIFSDKPATLKSGLAIPDQFFKIVIKETAPMKAIGFIYGQVSNDNSLAAHVVKIEDIEAQTRQSFDTELTKEELTSLSQPSKLEDWKSFPCGLKARRLK